MLDILAEKYASVVDWHCFIQTHLKLFGHIGDDFSDGLFEGLVVEVDLVKAGDLQGGLGGREATVGYPNLDEAWNKRSCYLKTLKILVY